MTTNFLSNNKDLSTLFSPFVYFDRTTDFVKIFNITGIINTSFPITTSGAYSYVIITSTTNATFHVYLNTIITDADDFNIIVVGGGGKGGNGSTAGAGAGGGAGGVCRLSNINLFYLYNTPLVVQIGLPVTTTPSTTNQTTIKYSYTGFTNTLITSSGGTIGSTNTLSTNAVASGSSTPALSQFGTIIDYNAGGDGGGFGKNGGDSMTSTISTQLIGTSALLFGGGGAGGTSLSDTGDGGGKGGNGSGGNHSDTWININGQNGQTYGAGGGGGGYIIYTSQGTVSYGGTGKEGCVCIYWKKR